MSKNVKFTTKEDDYLISAIKKHGRKSWSRILKDKNFEFHASRTRDSLRMRAKAAQFKRRLKAFENLNSSSRKISVFSNIAINLHTDLFLSENLVKYLNVDSYLKV